MPPLACDHVDRRPAAGPRHGPPVRGPRTGADGRRTRPHPALPARSLRPHGRARHAGHDRAGGVRRRRHRLCLLCARHHGDRGRRRRVVDRVPGAQLAGLPAPPAARHATAEGTLPAPPRARRAAGRLLPHRAGRRLGRRRDHDACRACRQQVRPERRQAVHHLGPQRRHRAGLRGDGSGRRQAGHFGVHRADQDARLHRGAHRAHDGPAFVRSLPRRVRQLRGSARPDAG